MVQYVQARSSFGNVAGGVAERFLLHRELVMRGAHGSPAICLKELWDAYSAEIHALASIARCDV